MIERYYYPPQTEALAYTHEYMLASSFNEDDYTEYFGDEDGGLL